jgi:hypothetical protein
MHVLIDFDSDLSELFDLSSNIRIRRIRKVEKFAEYAKDSLVPTWGQGLGIGREGRLFFVSECLGTSSEDDRDELDRLSTCLLLFKPDPKLDNRLSSFETEYGGGGNTPNSSLPVLASEELERGKSSFPSYFLQATELDDFKKFWLRLTPSAWHRTLMATSRRLLRSQARVGRESSEDRLVDLMTAFEALILEGESSKGPTIARRISKLLQYAQATQEQRAKERLELAYRMRNDALHDGQFSASNIAAMGTNTDFFLVEIEQLLRKAMVRYVGQMNLGDSKADIIKKFDH